MKYLALIMLASCCGDDHWQRFPAEHCPKNECLVWIAKDRPEGWTCDDLNRWERSIVPAYARNLRGKWAALGAEGICRNLQKYRVFFATSETFTLYHWLGLPKQDVYGATECYSASIKVGNSKTSNAIFHEAGHALSMCVPPADCVDGDDCPHAGWKELGFEAAEIEARLSP